MDGRQRRPDGSLSGDHGRPRPGAPPRPRPGPPGPAVRAGHYLPSGYDLPSGHDSLPCGSVARRGSIYLAGKRYPFRPARQACRQGTRLPFTCGPSRRGKGGSLSVDRGRPWPETLPGRLPGLQRPPRRALQCQGPAQATLAGRPAPQSRQLRLPAAGTTLVPLLEASGRPLARLLGVPPPLPPGPRCSSVHDLPAGQLFRSPLASAHLVGAGGRTQQAHPFP